MTESEFFEQFLQRRAPRYASEAKQEDIKEAFKSRFLNFRWQLKGVAERFGVPEKTIWEIIAEPISLHELFDWAEKDQFLDYRNCTDKDD